MRQAVFFDRDGVLNEEVGYLFEIERFKWIDGARDAVTSSLLLHFRVRCASINAALHNERGG